MFVELYFFHAVSFCIPVSHYSCCSTDSRPALHCFTLPLLIFLVIDIGWLLSRSLALLWFDRIVMFFIFSLTIHIFYYVIYISYFFCAYQQNNQKNSGVV